MIYKNYGLMINELIYISHISSQGSDTLFCHKDPEYT